MIGSVEAQGIEAIRFERRITRLGERVDQTGKLSEPAMIRTIQALRDFCGVLRDFSVKEVAVVGTSAMRSAKNRDVFLKQVFQETGLRIEVITGEEEARRTFQGIFFGLGKEKEDSVFLDIGGGGSTEFIFVKKERLDRLFSVPLGVVSLTEKFLQSDPSRPEEIKALEEKVLRTLHQTPLLESRIHPLSLIGTAGTVTTLAAMAQGLNRYDRGKVHNYILARESIDGILQSLLALPLSQRQKLPGIEAGREDVIIAGIFILLGVMNLLESSRVRVSDYGLVEGIVIHHAKGIGLLKAETQQEETGSAHGLG